MPPGPDIASVILRFALTQALRAVRTAVFMPLVLLAAIPVITVLVLWGSDGGSHPLLDGVLAVFAYCATGTVDGPVHIDEEGAVRGVMAMMVPFYLAFNVAALARPPGTKPMPLKRAMALRVAFVVLCWLTMLAYVAVSGAAGGGVSVGVYVFLGIGAAIAGGMAAAYTLVDRGVAAALDAFAMGGPTDDRDRQERTLGK